MSKRDHGAELFKKRRSLGLCIQCGIKTGGAQRCEIHAKIAQDQLKARKLKLVKLGVCRCGRRKSMPGTKRCRQCTTYNRTRTRKLKTGYRLRKVCFDCRAGLDRLGSRCIKCTNKMRVFRATSIPDKYSKGKYAAKKRGLEWKLSLEQYGSLITGTCHYCKQPYKAHGVSLDRVDNGKGYLINNVVECCTECNVAKSVFFKYDEMLVLGEMIGKIKAKRPIYQSSFGRQNRP